MKCTACNIWWQYSASSTLHLLEFLNDQNHFCPANEKKNWKWVMTVSDDLSAVMTRDAAEET